MVTDAQSGISIVTPQAFDLGTSQTPGSVRLAVISACRGITCPMWGSVLVVAPGATTGIHHHGEQDTIAYVLAGTCVVRWANEESSRQRRKPAISCVSPAWLPHVEINPSSTESLRRIVVRSTPTPIVVNLPDDYWQAPR